MVVHRVKNLKNTRAISLAYKKQDIGLTIDGNIKPFVIQTKLQP